MSEYSKKMKNYTARITPLGVLIDLGLLLLPTLCLALIIVLSIVFLPFVGLIYFILPMYFTVERRIRYKVTGLGKPNYSYADGYKDFYTPYYRGIFGVVMIILKAYCIGIACDLLLSFFSNAIFSLYQGTQETIQSIYEIYSQMTTSLETQPLLSIMESEGASLSRPLSLLFALILFLPCFITLFFFVDDELEQHHMATIILPDCDKNITAARGRAFSKGTVARFVFSERFAKKWRYGWPFMLVYVILYGLSTFFVANVQISNWLLLPVMVAFTPALSLLYGVILNYFILINDYIVCELSQQIMLDTMPKAISMSIYQTYNNPQYQHGEESAMRGCFVPAPTYEEQQQMKRENPFGFTANPFAGTYTDPEYTTKETQESPVNDPTPEEKPKPEKPKGVVVDFSDEDSEENNNNNEENQGGDQ